mgnify:CR=1 FL=1
MSFEPTVCVPAASAKTSTTTDTAIDFNAIKQRQQATWASGDYAIVGTTLQIVGEMLAEAADVRAGERVLDVAAGNGNASLAAARRFADADLHVDNNAVVRIRETDVQQRLNWIERRRNVRGAFAATRSLAGESVLLVDDVLTTGATLNELARVALAAGAAQVDALVLARVQPLRRRDPVPFWPLRREPPGWRVYLLPGLFVPLLHGTPGYVPVLCLRRGIQSPLLAPE